MTTLQLTIRPAGAADAEEIARVNHITWLATYRGILNPAYLEERSLSDQVRLWTDLLTSPSPSQERFVALEGERIVGYCGGGRNADSNSPFGAELFGIYVLPSWQGQGVGGKLLETLGQWARLKGHKAMQVWVMEQNPYRRFYEKEGGQLLDQSRDLEYGGQKLTVLSYGWADLESLKRS